MSARDRIEERYRRLFRDSRDGVYFTTRSGRIQEVNPAFVELFGYGEEELLRMNAGDLYADPEQRAEFQDAIEGMGSVKGFPVRLRRKDGSEADCLVTSSVRRGPEGQVLGYQGIVRDVTRMLRAREELREGEERFRTVAASAVDAVVVCDEEGRVTYWNESARLMFGYEADDVVGEPATVLMPERYRESHRRGLEGVGATGEGRFIGRTVELEGLRSDGTTFPLELSLSTWEQGGHRHYGAFIRDLEGRRQMERKLREAQRVEALAQVVGGLAHEFNNILTVVQGTAELLEGSLLPGQEDLRTDVQELKTAAGKGSGMVRKLLALGRRDELELGPLQLRKVVREFDSTLRRVFPENIRIEVHDDQKVPPVVADQGAVEQILLNLVTNARDAMPGGGTLRIALSERRFTEEDRLHHRWVEPGKYVCLAVSDTGTGMDEETRERVFEPFFTTKGEEKGSGLGLSVVFGLIKDQGGFVDVYSEPGRGTTFKVYLPRGEEEVERVGEDREEEFLVGGGETIVVAEDEPTLRRATRRALERLGYTVLVAEDGARALQLIRERGGGVDLLLSDVVMPSLDGPGLYRTLREEGICPRVLFSSGHTSRDLPELEGLVPDLSFVEKPWSLPDLARTVRQTLDEGPAEVA